MAKVKLSLAAAALATLIMTVHDKKTGRDDDDPIELAPGKSKTIDVDPDFHIHINQNGQPNDKADAALSIITAEVSGDDREVVIDVADGSGVVQSFTLTDGGKQIISVGQGQRLVINAGKDLT